MRAEWALRALGALLLTIVVARCSSSLSGAGSSMCARAALGRDIRVVLRFVEGRDVDVDVDALRCVDL